MKKVEIIEQVDPNADPYKAAYYFDSKTNKYTRGSVFTLSKKELEFYQNPEVNKRVVKHLWLDSPNRLEKSLQENKPNLSAQNPSKEELPPRIYQPEYDDCGPFDND